MPLNAVYKAFPKAVLTASDQARIAATPAWLLTMLLTLIKFMAGNLDAILALLAKFGITLNSATIELLKWLIGLLVPAPTPPGPQPA
jgi:hypothetical protein